MIPDSISTKDLAELLNRESEMQGDIEAIEQWERSREMADQTYAAVIKHGRAEGLDAFLVMDRLLERILDDQLQLCDRMAVLTNETNPDPEKLEKDRLLWAEEKGKIQAMLTIWSTTKF